MSARPTEFAYKRVLLGLGCFVGGITLAKLLGNNSKSVKEPATLMWGQHNVLELVDRKSPSNSTSAVVKAPVAPYSLYQNRASTLPKQAEDASPSNVKAP